MTEIGMIYSKLLLRDLLVGLLLMKTNITINGISLYTKEFKLLRVTSNYKVINLHLISCYIQLR